MLHIHLISSYTHKKVGMPSASTEKCTNTTSLDILHKEETKDKLALSEILCTGYTFKMSAYLIACKWVYSKNCF